MRFVVLGLNFCLGQIDGFGGFRSIAGVEY